MYSPTTPMGSVRHNLIVKHDTITGVERAHHLGAGRVSGEAVFVPSKHRSKHPSGEDDGWLMTIVHDLTRPGAALVILDAAAPERRPVATIHLPRRVPYGYHGEWIDDAAIGVNARSGGA
ncbi:MAG TPA: carotenoid oxygenase family protein [Jatrophihabitantaceae bacterium]